MNLIRKQLILLLVSILYFSGCIRNSEPNKQIQLTGINGSAYYHFDNKTEEVVLVVKPEYIMQSCNVTINRDTIKVEEEFMGFFSVRAKDYIITVLEPSSDKITGSFPPKKMPRDADTYTYKAKADGMYNFKGRIEYDTFVIPFEYKFIVLPKK